jgi:tRNA 2-thiouridine synthesizing protein A
MIQDSPENNSPPILPDQRLDVTGSLCPIPAIRTKRLLDDMTPGQILEVLASDPLAEMDLAVVCQRGGHELLESVSANQCVRVLIRVGQPLEI